MPISACVSDVMTKIDCVVMVMLENRSLDNLLGWLYADSRPKVNIPPVSGMTIYDGLVEGRYQLPLKPHWWSEVSYYPIVKGTGDDGYTVPNLDPNEGFPNVLNQCFGNAEKTVEKEPAVGTFAEMQGFLQDFDANDDTWNETLQITKTYTPEQLPILSTLARQYAVSDRFYCSMPTQTNPNRAFSLCGTSLGRLVNTWNAVEQFQTRTIWNALANCGVSMGVYYHEVWKDGRCFTDYTFPQLRAVHPMFRSIVQIDDPTNGFYALARQGKLPRFSYIEPKWGYGIGPHTFKQGNDYHPPTDVRPGEKLLYDIYNAMTASPQWASSLLIVTFDEHGGTYDHKDIPWGAQNPGDPASLHNPKFDFRLYGVRVPTVLVSPYVPKSCVFRAPGDGLPLDHCSTIATLLKWTGIHPANAGLWNRVAQAPTWENVIQSDVVNEAIQLPAPPVADPPVIDPVFDNLPASVLRTISLRSRTIETAKKRAEEYRRSVGLS